MNALVEMNNVSKTYPRLVTGRDRLRAVWNILRGRTDPLGHQILHDICLSVRPGESLGLIGVNGAGKSTLLKIIAGVVRPSSGEVTVGGRMGALLELGAGFHPDYSGRDNLRMAAGLMGIDRREIDRRSPEIIEFADIGDYIDEPVKHYSSGMVVRLGFAVVSTLRPDLLITDEILAVGDESFQKKCTAWMEDYLASGGTLILCSHTMYHIQKLCLKACWIHRGRIERIGDAGEVTREYLAFHERKELVHAQTPPSQAVGGQEYRILSLQLSAGCDEPVRIRPGEDLVVDGQVYSPDGRPPVVGIAVMRGANTTVYGVTSEMDGVIPYRLDKRLYGFSLTFEQLELLPGGYSVRAHAFDPEGMRVFDTFEVEFSVEGATRELGVSRLTHRWSESQQLTQWGNHGVD